MRLLNKIEETVIRSVARKLDVKIAAMCQLELSSRGILMRSHEGRRRAIAKKFGARYDCGKWALYMRMLLMPAMTRNQNSVVSLSTNRKRLTTRRPWKAGKTVAVLRSRRGLHAGHCTDDNRPTTKGVFELLCTGIALPDKQIKITTRNESHPFSTFVEDVHTASSSDVHVWETSLYSWP